MIGSRDEVPCFKYSKRSRLAETKKHKYDRHLHNLRIRKGIYPIEEELSGYNSKTCNLDLFMRYMIKKIDVNNRLYPLYADLQFRQYRWYSYVNTQKSDDRLINKVTEVMVNNAFREPSQRHHNRQHGIKEPIPKMFGPKNQTPLHKRERQIMGRVNKMTREEPIPPGKQMSWSRAGVIHNPAWASKKLVDSKTAEIGSMTRQIKKLDLEVQQQRLHLCDMKNALGQERRRCNGDQPSEPKRSICSVCKVDWNLIRSIIPIILVIGDWSKGSSHLRNSSPTPNMRLKRLLAKHFRLYEIDECYTSKRHWRTEEICGNLFCPDSTGQSRKVHRVLTFQTSNNRLGCINRDNNACHNMRKLYNWYISYCKGEPGYTVPRPPAYMLSGTNHPAVMQSAPQDQSNRTVAYRPLL